MSEVKALSQYILQDLLRNEKIIKKTFVKSKEEEIMPRIYFMCKKMVKEQWGHLNGCRFEFSSENDYVSYSNEFTRDKFNQIISRVETERYILRVRTERNEHTRFTGTKFCFQRVIVRDADIPRYI